MFGDISRYKIQALLPPDGPEPDEMPVIHGRIFPSFGRPTMISGKLEDSLEDTAVHDIQNEPAQISSRTHAVDFMALLQEKHGAQDITTRTAPMRVIIENNMNRPFPQSHKISLTMPTQDIFFHWDFECSHFSFKSLMSRMNWIADNELDFQVKLSNFGQSVRKCLQNCASDPDRFVATVLLRPVEKACSLTVTEIIQGYRKIHLLTIDFSPALWGHVKRAIVKDYTRIQKEYNVVKDSLVQALDTVAKYQPTLLLSKSLNMDPLPSVQPPKIQSMMDAIDSKGYTRSKNIIERNKAAFLAELQPTSTTHLIQSKSIPVEIVDKNKGSDMSGNHPALSAENKNLIFHFYSVGSQADPSSYSMTITDPIDLFFHFTSQAITRDVFKSLTRNIDLVESAVETSSARFSMRSGTFGPISNGALNFHHAEKKGGIIGVYSNDFMSGVIEDPERYRATLNVQRAQPQLHFNRAPSSRSYSTNAITRKPPLDPIFVKRVDDQITLELSFSDKSLFHTFTSIPILFEETAKTVLKAKIQHHYNEIKLQANAAQKRLSLVINEVSRKNIALLSLLNRIPTIRSEPLDHSFFPQVDDNLDDTSFENRYMNRLIPQRPVYVMTKIPIQCSASKQQNKFAESVRRPAKRNGLSTSERYRKSKEA